MQAIFLALLLAIIPSAAIAAIGPENFRNSVDAAEVLYLPQETEIIYNAIGVILYMDQYTAAAMTDDERLEIAEAVAAANYIADVDWKLILSVMFVESRMCHDMWLKGDKHLETFRSLGCMQVNYKWWGDILKKANISRQDLMDYQTGIVVGSLILNERINKYGFDGGIRRYNGSGPEAEEYRKRVMKVYHWFDNFQGVIF